MLVVSVFSYFEDPTVKFLSKREQGDSRVKITRNIRINHSFYIV